MDDKYIGKEVFEARIDVLEEKINSLTQIVEHTNDQLEIIAGLSKSVTEHQKDIESVRREAEHNKERLRRLEENQSKIVWAVGVAILGALVQFVLNGGLIKK